MSYFTLYYGPTWLYLALLHSTMALLGSTWLYYTQATIALPGSTWLFYIGFTWLYWTPLHSTMALRSSTTLYYTLPWLYLTRLDSTWLYYNCVKSLWYHWPLPTTSWIETFLLLLSGFCLSGIKPKRVAVCSAGHVSQKFAVTNGVRQRGGVLSPILFSVYIDTLITQQLLLILTTYALMQNSSVLLSPSFWVVKLVLLFGFRVCSFVWLDQLHTWALSPDYWSVWWSAWIFELSLQKVLG